MRFLEERTPEEIMGRSRHHPPPDPWTVPPRQSTQLCAYLAGDWCPGHASRFGRLAAGRATVEQAEQAHRTGPPARHAATRTRRPHSCTPAREQRSPRVAAHPQAARPLSFKAGRAGRQGGRPPFVQCGSLMCRWRDARNHANPGVWIGMGAAASRALGVVWRRCLLAGIDRSRVVDRAEVARGLARLDCLAC